MRGRTCVVLVVAAAAASAATARAAPPWEPERAVARPPGGVGSPAIDFRADGTARLSWLETPPGAQLSLRRFATMLQDGSVVLGGRLDTVAQPQYYGRDRVVALRARGLGRTLRPSGLQRYRLDALFGDTAGSGRVVSRRVATFLTYPGAEPFALGVDERGEVAVGWTDLRPAASGPWSFRVHVAFGRAGRGFGRPVTLEAGRLTGGEDVSAFAVAYSAGGDLVVAYTTVRRGRLVVAARVRGRRGALGAPRVLGPREAVTHLMAATAPDGRMVVAWGTQDGGEGAERPWVVRAAVRLAGRRFGRAQLLDPGEARVRVPGVVALDMSADGRAILAWSNAVGRGSSFAYPVRTSSTGRTDRFGRVAQLAANGAVHDVAVGPGGSATVPWSPFDPEEETLGPLYAHVRPAGGAAFGAPELVSSPDAMVYSADVTYDPRTGRPVAVRGLDAELRLSTRTG